MNVVYVLLIMAVSPSKGPVNIFADAGVYKSAELCLLAKEKTEKKYKHKYSQFFIKCKRRGIQ